MFLGAGLDRGSVLTGYVCTSASVSVFTGEVFVISDLVVGHALVVSVCRSLLRQVFSPFSTASQMVTAKAPPLPPVFLCISPQDQTVVVEVALIPTNAFFVYTTSIVYGASFQQSAKFHQFMPWMFVEGLQQAKNARIARCDKYLSAGVYGFSSPNGFMISSLTLESWSTLLTVVHRTETSSMGIGIGSIVVHSSHSGRQPQRVLRVVGTTSTSVSARSTAQDLPLRLRLALRLPFTCRAAGQSR